MSSDYFTYTPSRGEFTYGGVLWNAYTTPEIIKKTEIFKFLSSDIVVNTFPRSGTTLTQEIIWHIKNKHNIKKDEKYGDIDVRFPFLEFNSKFFNVEPFPIDVLESQTNESYRLIKTHCPFDFIKSNLLVAKPKCIIVFRNPRDVCVSLYHFYRGLELFGPWSGPWDEFVEMFQRGFTKCGSWVQWHKDWLEEIGVSTIGVDPLTVTSKQGLPILIYSYEMLIRNPKLIVQTIAKFIDEPLSEEKMEIILHNTDFRQMSSDNELNFTDKVTGFTFIRKGQIGNWKKYFSDAQVTQFNTQVEEHMEDLGISFEYE